MSILSRARGAYARTSPDPQGRPVLVVEDDAGVRAYLAALLEYQGYRVLAAASGEEAIALLGDESALLAVVDHGLPGMDGFAVVEHLAEGVPVIMVTGDPEQALSRKPGFPVLSKPFEPDDFGRAVQAAV